MQLARKRAKVKNIPFDLVASDIIIPEYCPILKIKLQKGKGVVCDTSPTLDRIDNKKGYTIDNIQVISSKANRIKTNASWEEILKVANYMKGIHVRNLSKKSRSSQRVFRNTTKSGTKRK